MVELLKYLKINLCGNIISRELGVIIGIDIKTFGISRKNAKTLSFPLL